MYPAFQCRPANLHLRRVPRPRTTMGCYPRSSPSSYSHCCCIEDCRCSLTRLLDTNSACSDRLYVYLRFSKSTCSETSNPSKTDRTSRSYEFRLGGKEYFRADQCRPKASLSSTARAEDYETTQEKCLENRKARSRRTNRNGRNEAVTED